MSEQISFSRFHLYPARRVLLDGDEAIRLGSRALDILILLARQPGQLIAHKDLLAHVWPGICVEEANLRVQIAAIRKALGEGRSGERYIATIPARGYCFVADVEVEAVLPGSLADRRTLAFLGIPQPLIQVAWRGEIGGGAAADLPGRTRRAMRLPARG